MTNHIKNKISNYFLLFLVSKTTIILALCTASVAGAVGLTANAGPDQTVDGGATVTLDSRASIGPAGETLIYIWGQALGNDPAFADIRLEPANNVPLPTFTAPDGLTADVDLVFELTVSGENDFSQDRVTITVLAVPVPVPAISTSVSTLTATAGMPITPVTIDASAGGRVDSYAISPAIGNSLSFDSTTGTISGTPEAAADAVSYTITASNVVGTDTAIVTITVTNNSGLTAVAVARPNPAPEGATVTLDGSDSSDSGVGIPSLDGSESSNSNADNTLTYAWTQTGGIPVTLSGANTVRASFTAPIRQTATDAVLIFQLMATSRNGRSATSVVRVTITTDVSVQQTVRAINGFLDQRTNLILANQPRAARRIARLKRGYGTEKLTATPGNLAEFAPFDFDFRSIGSGTQKFATSLNQITRAAGNLELQLQAGGGNGTVIHTRRRFDVWVEGSIHKFNGSGDSRGTFGIVHVGADYLVLPDLLVGIQGQYDDMSQSSGRQNYKVEGKGWMAGPYATARLHKNLYLDGRLAWGLSHNKISPYKTYTDKFTSERRLANINLSGSFSRYNWNLRPNISLSYLDDHQKSYVDSRHVRISGQRVSRGQVRMGPNLSARFEGPYGIILEPSATIDAIYSRSGTRGMIITNRIRVPDGWRARAEYGLTMTAPNGIRASVTGNYDGIGQSGFEAYGVGLNVGAEF